MRNVWVRLSQVVLKRLVTGTFVLGWLGLAPCQAQSGAVKTPKPERAQACARLLEKSAKLLGDDINQFKSEVSYDPDCHWLSFDGEYSIYRREYLPFYAFANRSHPDWSLRQAKLLRRRGTSWVVVHDIGDRFDLIELLIDRQGEAWWLQKVSGPSEPPRAEIWQSVKGQPKRFAVLAQIPKGLKLDPLGRPWVFSESENPNDFSMAQLIRYEAGGQLAEAWFATASPGQSGFAELSGALLQKLGWSAQAVKYGEPVFLRNGHPIAIPEGVSTIQDPASGRIWLCAPQNPAPPWEPSRLFSIEPDGKIRSFPELKDASLLHLDRKGQVWLTTGKEKPLVWKIGANLKPARQNVAIHDLQQAIGSVGFDPSSGYLLLRLALPKRLEGRRGYLESGLRNYGMIGDYTHNTEDIHLVDRNEMISTDYAGYNTMGYDTNISLYYIPELDLIARSSHYTDTHSYDMISESSLHILENDLAVLNQISELRYYRILNP